MQTCTLCSLLWLCVSIITCFHFHCGEVLLNYLIHSGHFIVPDIGVYTSLVVYRVRRMSVSVKNMLQTES